MSDQHESPLGVYEAMVDAETNHVITHENDKAWRDGVVLNRQSLLALRYLHVYYLVLLLLMVIIIGIRESKIII